MKHIVLIVGMILLTSCSGLLDSLRDRAMPYTVIKKNAGMYLVKFRYRPKVKHVESIYLVGTFNHWSCPGNDKGGRHYPMRYNASTRYWERVIQLSSGVYHYMYLINRVSTVVDEKNIHTLPNGGKVSRILLYK